MKFGTNVWITVIMTALQAIAQVSDLLPYDWKHWALAAQIVMEALKALLVHFSNPDGTPAQVPYQPVPGRNPLPPGVLVLALLLAPGLSAQTRARPQQIGTSETAEVGRVLVVLPNGTVAIARLAHGLHVDLTGPVPEIQSTIVAVRARSITTKPTQSTSVLPLAELPVAGSLHVYRNGLLLSEGEDYTRDSNAVRLVPGQEAQPGDILRVSYLY